MYEHIFACKRGDDWGGVTSILLGKGEGCAVEVIPQPGLSQRPRPPALLSSSRPDRYVPNDGGRTAADVQMYLP